MINYGGGKYAEVLQIEGLGAITFDQRGTLNEKNENAPIFVGKTGVLLFVPEGAVRTQTTVSIERQNIEEGLVDDFFQFFKRLGDLDFFD